MTDPILYWNKVALDIVASNHPDVLLNGATSPDQPGPTRTSRAYAIIHLAMNDAWLGASAQPGFHYLMSKGVKVPPPANPSPQVGASAVAAAAFHTLRQLYPQQAGTISRKLADFWEDQGNATTAGHGDGYTYGEATARELLALRSRDGSDRDEVYSPRPGPSSHRVDPLNPSQGFLHPRWGEVDPFTTAGPLNGPLLPPAPPKPTDAEYQKDFAEVRDFGGLRSSKRTKNQTRVGLFWAYDGALRIGVPPRLYNQVIRSIVQSQKLTNTTSLAQLFAAANAAMADAGISAWRAKYLYHVWRPVLGIREADAGWGVTAQGLPGGLTGDPFWLPLGAPRSNEPSKTSFTPNFPAYPSGHATFGTACLQVVRRFFGVPAEQDYTSHVAKNHDKLEFTFVSDELDGKTIDHDGSIRTRYTHTFPSVEAAIVENAESRIWLGVHWRFDANGGVRAGRAIGDQAATLFKF